MRRRYYIFIVALLLASALLLECSAGFGFVATTRTTAPARRCVHGRTRHCPALSFSSSRHATSGDDDDETSEEEEGAAEATDRSSASTGGLTSAPASSTPPPEVPRRPTSSINPLVASLTRDDQVDASSAERRSVPVLGEVTLDRSLFLIVPAVVFGVGGIALSVFVALHAGDVALSDAWQGAAATSSSASSDDGCRGLCFSQADNLESLRATMNAFKR